MKKQWNALSGWRNNIKTNIINQQTLTNNTMLPISTSKKNILLVYDNETKVDKETTIKRIHKNDNKRRTK